MSDIDPSTVKAGDTVTLESGTALVRDVVIEAKSRGVGQFVFYTAENPDPLIPGTYYLVNSGAWTLTDHQPTPEPEPEWKPGTVAEGTINGKAVRGVVGHALTGGDAAFVYWNEFAGHLSSTHTPPANLRPLVVVDPAAVDVDALVDTFCAALDTATREGIIAVLGELGIEAS